MFGPFTPKPSNRRPTTLSIEELESRALPAASAFAVIEGQLPAGSSGDQVTIHIRPSDFNLPQGNVSLKLVARDAAGHPLAIGPLSEHVSGSVLQQFRSGAGVRFSQLAEGDYSFVVGAGNNSGAGYHVRCFLAGDVNGDQRITSGDLQAIRARFGASSSPGTWNWLAALPGQFAYLASADVDGNGRINSRDLFLAGRNAAVSTTLQPLKLQLDSTQISPTSQLVTVLAHTSNGAMVTFTYPDGTEETVSANADGLASVPLLVQPGSTDFKFSATDGFGQRNLETIEVTRAALTNYLGAAFQPYVKQWTGQPPNASVPLFNSYASGKASVTNQVNLIGPSFPTLATYGSGYNTYYPVNQPVDMLDSNCLIAGAAASYNQAHATAGNPVLTVSQGIQALPQDGNLNNVYQTTEINDAFTEAQNANALFAGTVNRLIFTNEYITNAPTTNDVDGLIKTYIGQAHQMGLTVGVRSNAFGLLTNPNPTDPAFKAAMQQLVKDVDFIMLNLYPTNEYTQTIQQAASDVESQYANIKSAALALNSKLDVIISETGWPKEGIGFNDFAQENGETCYLSQDNTVANAQAYYNAIKSWANQQQVQTLWFEAIDEPWKSNQKQPPGDACTVPNGPSGQMITNFQNPWQGPMGGEGYYGVWTYNSSGDNGQFVQNWAP